MWSLRFPSSCLHSYKNQYFIPRASTFPWGRCLFIRKYQILHPLCKKARLLQRASCLKVCLSSGNVLPSAPWTRAVVQVHQMEKLWKFSGDCDLTSSYVGQGEVMLYMKQENGVHLTLSTHCHWSRSSVGWLEERSSTSHVGRTSLGQGLHMLVEMFLWSLAAAGPAPTRGLSL